MKQTLVKDVMTRRVLAVAEDTPFKVVLLAMRLNHVNALPVLDAAGEVRGIVSAADLMTSLVHVLEPGGPRPLRTAREWLRLRDLVARTIPRPST